jgi:hypothetical protein
MKRYLAFIILILGTILLMVYAADYLLIRYKLARNHHPFGSVTVGHYYAIEKKANKTEYVFAGTQDEQCVNSLFPHLGAKAVLVHKTACRAAGKFLTRMNPFAVCTILTLPAIRFAYSMEKHPCKMVTGRSGERRP